MPLSRVNFLGRGFHTSYECEKGRGVYLNEAH